MTRLALWGGVTALTIAGLCIALLPSSAAPTWPDVTQTLGVFFFLAVVAVAAAVFGLKPYIEWKRRIEECEKCEEKGD